VGWAGRTRISRPKKWPGPDPSPPLSTSPPPSLATASAPHVLHLTSFSKAYGMAGWRVGAVVHRTDAGLGPSLLKMQDTIPICPTQTSQAVALAALTAPGAGRQWVDRQVLSLAGNRAAVAAALAPLAAAGGGASPASAGAIYLWAKLPPGADDGAVVEWLVRSHGVCLIPGSACGAPGCVRAAFANLEPAECARAAARLGEGVAELVARRGPWKG